MPEPVFIDSARALRAWLAANHAGASELWLGFHKKGAPLATLTWEEAVDEALCYGWIDGIRKGLGPARYVIRFTPRRARSVWSARNVSRVRALTRGGLMEQAGLAAFAALRPEACRIYSYEQRKAARLSPGQERRFKGDRRAWAFFMAQAPSYRKVATWWVIRAKRDETQARRLEALVDASREGRTIDSVRRPLRGPGGPPRAPA